MTDKKRSLTADLARFDGQAAGQFRRERPDAPAHLLIAGIDEAGRGPLAGPVVAAAVIFPEGAPAIEGVNDSKKLTEKQREALFPFIHRSAVAIGVGVVDAETIDRINILEATRLAAGQALKSAQSRGAKADLVLLDALKLDDPALAQRSVIKGDAQSQAIAAASIVAKVTRDRLMVRYDAEYPEYGFARHKGYGCAGHVEVLGKIGPCALHRLSFGGVSFFHDSCRYSLTYHRLLERIAAKSERSIEEEIAAQIAAQEGFLPAREMLEIRRRFTMAFSTESADAPGRRARSF